ncbi:hypothetical protein [Bacteroides nordii]
MITSPIGKHPRKGLITRK